MRLTEVTHAIALALNTLNGVDYSNACGSARDSCDACSYYAHHQEFKSIIPWLLLVVFFCCKNVKIICKFLWNLCSQS